MDARVEVTFEPTGATVQATAGETVMSAASRAGLTIPAPCGGRGVCGACGVRVIDGELEPPDEYEAIGLRRAPEGVRLACRARVRRGPVVVRPLVAHSAPSAVTEPQATETAARYVAGVDLGTTTVSAQVMDRASGDVVGRGSTANRQQAWGSDVVSRISAALDGHADDLKHAAEASIVDALANACSGDTCSSLAIERIAVAANSAMTALLTGASVEPLAAHPFAAPNTGVARIAVGETALAAVVSPECGVTALPCIAAFVGGDTTAALIGTDMLEEDATRLLVDLGTNAEVALVSRGALWVASAAAGPAFEAGGMSCGGPAAPGGVVGVHWDGSELTLDVVGGAEPMWLAGSGALSAIATLVRLGHIGSDGLMTDEGPLARGFSRDGEGVLGITLAGCDEGCVRLDQRDVRAFQLAKAAVFVAIRLVMDEARVKPRKVEETLLAGAFGASLDADDLVALGVVPRKLRAGMRIVGDAALEGASRVAMRPSLGITAATHVAQAHHVDLAMSPRFQSEMLDAMSLTSL